MVFILQINNINKKYITGDLEQTALDDVTLTFRDSEFVAILGPSGSGKTTLLNIIGGLDRYDSGDLIIDGVSTKEYTDRDWDSYRNHTIGFVFQSYNLIPHQDILSNVELALTISNVSPSERKARALEALDKVGLKEQAHKKPNQMSGGQMQRVAIARALVNNPDIILADEPTGALDTKTSVQIMDLLKEVADDRLVIMVTHNPELADKYATRIINLLDGKIVSDSMPVDAGTAASKEEKPPKTSLGFLTALALSLNNLRTKKGRTILTSTAGSVGIIGIALILALSNGVNTYIKSIEQEMLGSYPVTLTKQTINLEEIMSQQQETADSEQGILSSSDDSSSDDSSGDSTSGDTESSQHDSDKIYSRNVVGQSASMSAELFVENDLTTFKSYLEDNADSISDKVTAIEYSYDISPKVFRNDSSAGVVKVSPASLEVSGSSDTTTASSLLTSGVSTEWSQLNDSQTLRENDFELLEGSWPTEYNEVALVVNQNNEISDFTLYSLGLLDISEMDAMLEAINNGEDYEDQQHSFDMSEAIGKTYTCFAPAELYKLADRLYVDESDNETYMTEHLSDGIEVKITAVLRTTEDGSGSSGVYYTGALTKELMRRTAETAVVKAQLASPDVNVLTGAEFSETESGFSSGFDLSSIFGGSSSSGSSVSSLLSSFMSETDDTPEVESLGMYLYKPNQMTPTPLIAQTSTENSVSNDIFGSYLSSALWDQLVEYTEQMMTDVMMQMLQNAVSSDVVSSLVQDYMSNLSEEEMMELVQQFAGNLSEDDIQSLLGSVDVSELASEYLSNMSEEELQALISQFAGSMSEEDMQSLISQFAGNLEDMDLQSIIDQYLGEDGIQALISQFTGSGDSSAEEVLSSLGYVTEDDPSTISIYPVDFESKTYIEDLIDDYNAQVEDDTQKVTYTDYIGTITSSITKIVDVISYVLIAFVAISLLVSSIMIAIITDISVLERTKEIGVLRALGSSKKDVSRIFNAETFIEGALAGIIGVVFTWIVSIPINKIIYAKYAVDNVAYLPIGYALLLIALSIVLTLLAGYFPARSAAKKDPVLALRTE